VSIFCELFDYSKQAYYKQSKNKVEFDFKQHQAKEAVLLIRRQMPRIGTRKLYYMLKEEFSKQELKIGRDKLFTVLRKEGLLIKKKKNYTITTNSKHWMRTYPNLIKDMVLTRPEQAWVSDITFVYTKEGNAYLHLVTDAYSKQVMGHELCDNMEASSTSKALQMAIKNRKYNQPLIHHSDRGSQYCSKLYTDMLKENNIQISMTENGDPYENAVAERLNGILKDEFGLGEQLESLSEAIYQTKQAIAIYNSLRPHLSCEMSTPKQMHNQQTRKLKKWNKKTSNILVNV
jgi:putative transposase